MIYNLSQLNLSDQVIFIYDIVKKNLMSKILKLFRYMLSQIKIFNLSSM